MTSGAERGVDFQSAAGAKRAPKAVVDGAAGMLVMTRRFGANPLLLGDPSEGCLQSVDKA